ncbi:MULTISPECIES: type II toxin-antitoxin system ParD family antitoxin [Serratia]|uniref:type II toxin-antitoxin system ParD family antitoxin n=1 Tax=Serratia TaxID=613 RepID=UPI00188B903F|nr:type II toxin-antitoxin system ParD family antitoxin [Serratia marcescens]MBF8217761.1 type II toxin-antitoxin system ParD family antitoxin [Serratia ureilytica]MBF4651825.1 type II toxin-antitoxin system ParD family antitoxin [Serratia marcescens]MBF8242866.1 type II toxin-antitoxin system ParD family antitoxin [Serratia ureilytica]MBH1914538.1 type II toxin-antitoxin system ParD family antitoxin [Serratia marcescens]MBH2676071.1 type II toxin-antitoxin system ParD family antitoxin [Serrat
MGRTLTVDLGDELRSFVEDLVASGDYRTPSEVIRESVRTLRERTATSKLEELRRLIAEGENSGESVEWDRDVFMERIRSKAKGCAEK